MDGIPRLSWFYGHVQSVSLKSLFKFVLKLTAV
jgi:hypothetical protein